MNRGKNICNQLKAVRRRIAEENGIPLDISECTWKGECRGTCPQCEAEVRYLESVLTERVRLGKVATVAGLALGLAATAQAQAPQTNAVPEVPPVVKEAVHVADSITLCGKIVDSKSKEEIPFCRIQVDDCWGDTLTNAVLNDFNGTFKLKVPIVKGRKYYNFIVEHYGYKHYGTQIRIEDKEVLDLGVIELETGYVPTIMLGGVEPTPISTAPAGHEEYFQGSNCTDIIVR